MLSMDEDDATIARLPEAVYNRQVQRRIDAHRAARRLDPSLAMDAGLLAHTCALLRRVRATTLSTDRVAEVSRMDLATIRRLPNRVALAFVRHAEPLVGAARRLDAPMDPHLESLLPALAMLGAADLTPDRIREVAGMDLATIRRLPNDVALAYIRHVERLIGAFRAERRLDRAAPMDPGLASLVPALMMLG
jgi:hypothetical protein